MIRNRKLLRAITVFLLVQFCFQTFFPAVGYALTSGPSQPEFSSFEPVATTNMVDEFTGDFTYNLPVMEVPGPHGSGYPLSLSYHSGVTPEEEASWVGYGWTLNAGAINRHTRGIPDDHNGQDIVFHNKMPKNWTASAGASLGFEPFGKDLKRLGANASISTSLRYNNYRGFGYTQGVGISLGKGLVSMGYSVSDGDGSFSLNVNPYAILSWNFNAYRATVANKDRYLKNYEKYKTPNNRLGLGSSLNIMGSNYGLFTYSQTSRPNIVHPFSGKSFNFSVGFQGNSGPVPAGPTINLSGSYSYQENKEKQEVPAFGYLYLGEVTKDVTNMDALMDYHVEHEGDLNQRDQFIGIPFNDADNYAVSGEGVGGGFRLYNKTAGHFGPRAVSNEVKIYNIGGEIAAGWTFGPGGDLGKGISRMEVKDWKDRKDLSVFQKRIGSYETPSEESMDEPVFFRFNNDLGGEWGTGHDDKPFNATYSGNTPKIPDDIEVIQRERSGRSSYIDYHTNEEMLNSAGVPSTVAYSRIDKLNTYASRLADAHKKLIGEITVFTGAGLQYNYGLPVYNKNEKNLSYSAEGLQPEHNFIAFPSSPNTKITVGEERNAEYASTYLLTEILTPDYLDKGATNVGDPGSSPDDLGGYTRFNYEKLTPGGDNWFNWRAPYRGLLYNKNSRSDAKDDMGSYSEGEKEIYMLHSIETKTHVAIFETENREDGREALVGVTSNTESGQFKLKKLKRIELYSLNDCVVLNGKLVRDDFGSPQIKNGSKPIKTVHFEHDDTLNEGLPNHTSRLGKLTLKRVYFEYNGISRVRISPYEFKYNYPDYSQYPSRYTPTDVDDVTTGYSQFTAGDQNPDYSYFLTDPWGYYQLNGAARFEHSRPWIDQAQTDAHFDPAAWNLKVIKLPSGGEIHVQYEQDDYRYVQDQEAHVMASLKVDPVEEKPVAVYKIDLTTIGLTASSSQAEFDRALQLFNDRYVKRGKKIYFKFLYRLIGKEMSPVVDYELSPTCNAEYVSGYASVDGRDEFKPQINPTEVTLTFCLKDQRFPKQVCIDFVKAQRLGKIDPKASCNPAGMSNPDSPKALVNQLSNMISSLLIPGDDDLCAKLDRSHSYFRIPTPLAKKGGGIRVKRLMMYDAGLGTNDPVLYGNEYRYETADGLSSGVATNEPMTIREENILIDFVARKGQGLWSKIVAGKDRDQSEGPIGESILPGPSVGYSRVVVKNIYSGQSRPTYAINEYYTVKDYPVKTGNPDDGSTMTNLNKKNDKPEVIPAPFYSKVRTRTRATQGFSFVLNNMHGQPRRQATYKGLYNPAPGALREEVSSTQYDYFQPGETVPMMSSLYGGVQQRNPGREVDITFAQRSVLENVNDVNVEVDLQVTIIPLAFVVLVIPYPTAIPSFSYVEGELSTHATTKVVRYPAIVKRTTVKQDGIEHTQENLAFDEYTGQPVAVRSTDEFNGAYLTQNIPASWEYKEMSGKWKTQGKKFAGAFTVVDNTIALPAGNCALGDFTPGDKLALGTDANAVYYYVTGLDWLYNRLEVVKANSSVDASGNYTTLTILSTGRTNQLGEQAGAITSHNEMASAATPVVISASTRYTAHDFTTHLKEAVSGRTTAGDFTLPGTYTNMDMSGFASELQGCVADVTNVTISGVQFLYTPNAADGTASLQLMKFTVDCTTGADKTVKAEGWE